MSGRETEIAKMNKCKIRSSKSLKYKIGNPRGVVRSDLHSCNFDDFELRLLHSFIFAISISPAPSNN